MFGEVRENQSWHLHEPLYKPHALITGDAITGQTCPGQESNGCWEGSIPPPCWGKATRATGAGVLCSGAGERGKNELDGCEAAYSQGY